MVVAQVAIPTNFEYLKPFDEGCIVRDDAMEVVVLEIQVLEVLHGGKEGRESAVELVGAEV